VTPLRAKANFRTADRPIYLGPPLPAGSQSEWLSFHLCDIEDRRRADRSPIQIGEEWFDQLRPSRR